MIRAGSVLVRAFRAESSRTLLALKAYADARQDA